jgi:alkanesulfonate monooxygenase SsuD/methylene tetrahydromethanopterin reductase-like flavin-dependent oxidoreductase (luciferase family)
MGAGVKIGIGLPNPVPNIPGNLLVDWAQRAEAAGFSGLVTIDRIAYPSYDSLTSLAAAGAKERISLMTNILLAPIYTPVLLAKTAASIDQISSGRFSLGLAAGGRPDDYEVTGRDFHRRGREFDNALDVMHRVWRGEALTSVPQLRDAAKGFEDAGFTQLYFDPTVAAPDQIDRLAAAVL